MSVEALGLIAREVVDLLVQGNYELLVRRHTESRLTSRELRAVVDRYGRKLTSPPDSAYQNVDAVEVKNAAMPTWSVRLPLWTKEEGRSDLTLELTITLSPGKPEVELDDLHVL